jgi:hypothetical protein
MSVLHRTGDSQKFRTEIQVFGSSGGQVDTESNTAILQYESNDASVVKKGFPFPNRKHARPYRIEKLLYVFLGFAHE